MSSVSIENTSLWADIKDILNSEEKKIKYNIAGTVHTEKDDIKVVKLLAKDIVRDYVNNIGDIVHVEFVVALGDYINLIYPYRANLEFSIQYTPFSINGEKQAENSKINIERYKAVFLVDKNPNYTGTDYERMDYDSLNSLDTVNVFFQLLDRSLEPIRIKTVQGVYRQTTQKKLLHTLISGESMKVRIDGKPAIDGINIVDPDNHEVKKHVIISSGTRLTSLPTFLQEEMGGVYSTGIGNYIQTYDDKKMWFVYPLFKTGRFKTSKDDRVIFYALTQGKYSGTEKTYFKDASVLKIAVTGQRKYQDSADIDYMNRGSGFRMTDARALMKKPIKMTDSGPKFTRGQLNTEVAAGARDDGLNFAPKVKASANPFKEYSVVNARNIARVDLVWENANPDLIYPGMPCKYLFLEDNDIIELHGTIGFIQATTALIGQGINGRVYQTNCAVTLLAEQKPNTKKTM